MAFLDWSERPTSKNADWLREVQKEKGIRVKTLEEKPNLQRHLSWVWQAFTDLNYRRGVAMSGAVPITYSDMEAYCRLKGIYSLLERERLVRFLDILDRHWMAKHYEKQKQREQQATKTPPKTPPLPSRRNPPRTRVS